MASDRKRPKFIIIGGGPTGSLSGIFAAQRGFDVEIYELRSDLRDPSTTPLNFTRSINLALSERGVNALRHAQIPGLLEEVMKETIPMRGRMIHGRDMTGELYEQSQQYDIENRGILAVDRGGLNKILLDQVESMPNVKINFNYKLTGADFKKRKAWFEIMNDPKATGRNREIEIDFDLLIGADGAHSAARYHLMKFARLDYHQEYIDTLWCEFKIEAKMIQANEDPNSRFRISQNHLHIWPGKQFMFIAIPSFDGSFTCTLFLPSAHFTHLSTSPSTLLPQFFDTHFPGVTSLIPPSSLIDSFISNPHLPLISIKCAPYHFNSSAVIVGDAAHAMVPFYGQGMNAGLEDVRILFEHLDACPATPSTTSEDIDKARGIALQAYSAFRQQDAYAINDLALRNYEEMRSSVVDPVYKARKYLEEWLSVRVPNLGWKTQYSRVSFGNERYSEVIRKSERQGRLLVAWSLGLGVPVLGSVVGMLGYGLLNWWARRNR